MVICCGIVTRRDEKRVFFLCTKIVLLLEKSEVHHNEIKGEFECLPIKNSVEVELCARKSHWHVQNVNKETTILQRIKKHIQTEWKQRNIADSARLIPCIKKRNSNISKRKERETMGETVKTDKTQKTSFFKGVKAEFKKITWPDKRTMGKQTVAVTVIAVIMGLVIAFLDTIIKFGVNFLTSI